jgi:hypothetical protein
VSMYVVMNFGIFEYVTYHFFFSFLLGFTKSFRIERGALLIFTLL